MDRAEAVAAEMDAMRENALAAALAEARHSLAALQRQHEAGQKSLAELQVLEYLGIAGLLPSPSCASQDDASCAPSCCRQSSLTS